MKHVRAIIQRQGRSNPGVPSYANLDVGRSVYLPIYLRGHLITLAIAVKW